MNRAKTKLGFRRSPVRCFENDTKNKKAPIIVCLLFASVLFVAWNYVQYDQDVDHNKNAAQGYQIIMKTAHDTNVTASNNNIHHDKGIVIQQDEDPQQQLLDADSSSGPFVGTRSEKGGLSTSGLSATETKTSTISNIRPEFCEDPDKQQQQSEEVDEEGQSGFICKCTDPTIPVAVEPDSRYHKDWMAQHERMVQDIRFRKRKRRTTIPLPLDFVMMGDSLVEHWNGTKLLGKTPAPAMRKLFESLFTKREGSLEGMALGSSMDKSPNLLWHLHNGILPPQNNNNNNVTPSLLLQPKVWLILIGTNDLFGARCSKESTLQGILQVAHYIKSQQPQAAILIHGLLPRGEGKRGRQAMTLGNHWQDIQWINQQLLAACQRQQQKGWYYMDTGHFFLNDKKDAINSRLMGDGVHPRISGMKGWGPMIVKAVHEILAKQKN